MHTGDKNEYRVAGEKREGTTEKTVSIQSLLLLRSLLSGLGNLAALAVGLLDTLDDTDGDGLPHVTDGEATKRRILAVGLDAHRLARDELDNAGITRFDELGRRLHDLTRSTIDLLNELGELAGNVCGVAIEHWGVAGTNLTRVVEDNDLGVEGSGLLGGVVLRVGSDVATADILDRHVLDVEPDVVPRNTLNELLVVHLDGLDFSGHV